MPIVSVGDHAFGYSGFLNVCRFIYLSPELICYRWYTMDTVYRATSTKRHTPISRRKLASFSQAPTRTLRSMFHHHGPRSQSHSLSACSPLLKPANPWGILPRQANANAFGAGKPDINPEDKRFAETNPRPAPQPQEVQDDWNIAHDDWRPPPYSPARVEEPYPEAQPNRQGSGPSAQQSDTSAPYGILRSCFGTLQSCEEKTHSCSGHGECMLKSDDKTSNTRCYACACRTTSKEVNGRLQYTKWAGPACQKKDISMPFWLLGGTSVALVSVIAWAIALLYAMGQEELPSVIGAGVTGVRSGK